MTHRGAIWGSLGGKLFPTKAFDMSGKIISHHMSNSKQHSEFAQNNLSYLIRITILALKEHFKQINNYQ